MISRSTRVAVSDAVSSSATSKSRPESLPSPRSSGSNSAKVDAVGLTATVIDVGDEGAEGSGRLNPDSYEIVCLLTIRDDLHLGLSTTL